jgi:DNA-binding MarR family transcriptional regulator
MARSAVGPEECAAAARVCACFQLRRTARAVTRLFDEVLQPCGLRSPQFVMLVAIRASGQPTLPALAKALGVERSTLTRNLASLQRSGLVERRSVPGSQMSSVLLTRKGLGVLAEGVPLWQKAQSRFVGALTKRPWEEMLPLLEDIQTAAGS